ncbi:type II secretion system protein N [Phenylobacterium sp. J367]|uniref:type II secretion system protein N n=1 Tax=Phenylobacterium sp. J367 TaxID=2898435 RepID=UPI002151EFDC|nr:type II secretion system protein N [Phenylobacterium sp. J367]MCR5881088.1 type II secretion system protein N [Phenylobacterium sp. J367]
MRRLWAVFALALPAALLLLVPLRMALGWIDADRAGLSAQGVEGTIWRGTLHDARLRGLPLGEARAGLAPFRGGVALAAVQGRGVVRPDGVSDVHATLPLGAVASGLPLQGDLGLRSFTVTFRAGACRRAGGEVRLSNLKLGAVAPPGLELRGQAACRNGRLAIPLTGQSGAVALEAVVTVDGRGVYQLDTTLRATDPLIAAAAQTAGFAQGLDGFSRTDRGRLGG